MECSYCKTVENNLKCLDCNEFFCNNKKGNMSHIIFHLIKNKHKNIRTTKDYKCTKCADSNIFRLGITKSESLSSESIFCRSCSSDQSWNPLIEERCFINDVIGTGKTDFDNKKIFEIGQDEVEVGKVKMHFKSGEYLSIFSNLLKIERLEEQKFKESLREENIKVTFTFKETLMASFANRFDSESRINIGDEIILIHANGIEISGFVLRGGEDINLRISNRSIYNESFEKLRRIVGETSEYSLSGFTMKYVWKAIGYDRMITGLYKFKMNCSQKIYEAIMTGTNETHSEINIVSDLNESQKLAVKAALTRSITLIQGPPGTGKTVTCAEIVKNFVKKGFKVLVVAPSNIAVDQVTAEIYKTGVKVLRVMSKNREGVTSTVEKLSLHYKLATILEENFQKISSDPESRFSKSVVRQQRDFLVKSAEVVTCTCITAGGKLFSKYKFPVVLIDEAVQSTEPQSIIPLTYGCEKLILIGDHKQLGPTILNRRAEQAGLNQSLFERLVLIGITPYLLSTQYRMHPDLAEYPNLKFYNGQITSGVKISNRVSFMHPTFFYCSYGKEELSASGTSFLNRSEGFLVNSVVSYLNANGVQRKQIGVITFYEGQRLLLQSLVNNVEISNVDGFQGREKDFIILSLVRSNDFQGIGFVKDARRVNVALTRAKYGLVIIGNPNTLLKNELWKDILTFYDTKNLILDGPIDNLRPVILKKNIFDFKAIADSLDNI